MFYRYRFLSHSCLFFLLFLASSLKALPLFEEEHQHTECRTPSFTESQHREELFHQDTAPFSHRDNTLPPEEARIEEPLLNHNDDTDLTLHLQSSTFPPHEVPSLKNLIDTDQFRSQPSVLKSPFSSSQDSYDLTTLKTEPLSSSRFPSLQERALLEFSKLYREGAVPLENTENYVIAQSIFNGAQDHLQSVAAKIAFLQQSSAPKELLSFLEAYHQNFQKLLENNKDSMTLILEYIRMPLPSMQQLEEYKKGALFIKESQVCTSTRAHLLEQAIANMQEAIYYDQKGLNALLSEQPNWQEAYSYINIATAYRQSATGYYHAGTCNIPAFPYDNSNHHGGWPASCGMATEAGSLFQKQAAILISALSLHDSKIEATYQQIAALHHHVGIYAMQENTMAFDDFIAYANFTYHAALRLKNQLEAINAAKTTPHRDIATAYHQVAEATLLVGTYASQQAQAYMDNDSITYKTLSAPLYKSHEAISSFKSQVSALSRATATQDLELSSLYQQAAKAYRLAGDSLMKYSQACLSNNNLACHKFATRAHTAQVAALSFEHKAKNRQHQLR